MGYKRKGWHIPGYNYCGPGTWYPKGKRPKPINAIDEACKRHDDDPEFDYSLYNNADARLIDDVERNWKEDPFAAGVISSIFRTKRYVTKRKQPSTDDLPSNVISHDSTRGLKSNSRPLATTTKDMQRGRYLGGRKRRVSYKRIRTTKPSTKPRTYSRKGKSSFAKKVARVFNPARTYELDGGFSVNYNNDRLKSMFIDPAVYPVSTRTSSVDKCSMTQSNMKDVYQKLGLGAVSNTQFPGQKFWMLSNKQYFKMTNFSNSTMFLTIYWCKAKQPIETPASPLGDLQAAYLNNLVQLGTTPGSLVGTLGAVGNNIMVDRNMSLKDFPNFNWHWQIVSQKDIKLEPNDQHSVCVRQKPRLWSADRYNFSELMPGDVRLLIRLKTELTVPTLAGVSENDNNKGFSFTDQTIAFFFKTFVRIAPQQSLQRVNYIDHFGGTDLNYSALGQVVGDAVNDSGAANNMVS